MSAKITLTSAYLVHCGACGWQELCPYGNGIAQGKADNHRCIDTVQEPESTEIGERHETKAVFPLGMGSF